MFAMIVDPCRMRYRGLPHESSPGREDGTNLTLKHEDSVREDTDELHDFDRHIERFIHRD
jgi:hypothetical protein